MSSQDSYPGQDKTHSSQMHVWCRFIPAAYPELKKIAGETKADRETTLDELCVPRYVQYIMPVGEFLDNPDIITSTFRTDTTWFQLLPSSNTGKKATKLDIPKEDLVQQVAEALSSIPSDNYRVLVSEYVENIISGNLVIKDDGQVIGELANGTQDQVASGNRIPDYTVRSRFGTEVLYYSFEDYRLRRAIANIVSVLKKSNAGIPGYYELTFIGDNLQPIILDAIVGQTPFIPDNV